MVLHCANCDCLISEPIYRFERHGLEGPWKEELICCPRCHIAEMLEEVSDDEAS